MPTSPSTRTRAPAPVVAIAAAAAVMALAMLQLPGRSANTGDPPGTGTIVEVVDGDTVVVDLDGHQEHVRLIGIDTPESVAPDRPDECFGAQASHRLAELVPAGTAMRLERDIEARDQYDRLLAYLYRADDDLFVNLAQVSDGYAESLTYPPNTAHRADFERAERDARATGAGLWRACGSADVPLG
jgi:micrococcal nuclease